MAAAAATAARLETDWNPKEEDLRANRCIQRQAVAVRGFYALLCAAKQGTDSGEMMERVRQDWFRWFMPLSMETLCGAYGIAWTDMGFVAMCHVWARRSDDEDLTFTDIWHSWVELVVIGSQHTSASAAQWPTQADWESVRTHMAQVVRRYLSGAPASRTALIRQLEQVEDGEAKDAKPAHVIGVLPDELTAALAEREMPPSLALFKKQERETMAAKVLTGEMRESDVRQEASIEAQGAMWRATATDIVHNFTRLATRTMFKVDRDNALAAGFPRVAPRVFNRHVYVRAYAWVVARCETEQTDAMTKLFRDTSNTWLHPMGSDTHRYRAKLTRNDLCGAQGMLRDEIGIDLMQHMHERSMVRMKTLAATHPGVNTSADACLLWSPLFLVLLHYALLQHTAKKVVFLDTYVHSQSHERASRARMDESYFRGMPRRPLLVLAQRRWWLHHGHALHGPHDSLLHAVLEWFYMLASEFRGKNEDGYDVSKVGSIFLGADLETCLRGSV